VLLVGQPLTGEPKNYLILLRIFRFPRTRPHLTFIKFLKIVSHQVITSKLVYLQIGRQHLSRWNGVSTPFHHTYHSLLIPTFLISSLVTLCSVVIFNKVRHKPVGLQML